MESLKFPDDKPRRRAPRRRGWSPGANWRSPTRITAELDCAGASAWTKRRRGANSPDCTGKSARKSTGDGRRRGLGVRNEHSPTRGGASERARYPGGSRPAPGRTRAARRGEREDGGGGAGGSGGRGRRGVAGGVVMGPTGVWASNFERRVGGEEEARWWGPPWVICTGVVAWTWTHRSHNFSSQFVFFLFIKFPCRFI